MRRQRLAYLPLLVPRRCTSRHRQAILVQKAGHQTDPPWSGLPSVVLPWAVACSRTTFRRRPRSRARGRRRRIWRRRRILKFSQFKQSDRNSIGIHPLLPECRLCTLGHRSRTVMGQTQGRLEALGYRAETDRRAEEDRLGARVHRGWAVEGRQVGLPWADRLWAGPPWVGPLWAGLPWAALCSRTTSHRRPRIQGRGRRCISWKKRRTLHNGFGQFLHPEMFGLLLPAIAGVPSLHFGSSPDGGAGPPGGFPPGGSSLGGSSFGGSPLGGSSLDGSSFLPQQKDLPPTSSQISLGSNKHVFVEASHSKIHVFYVCGAFKRGRDMSKRHVFYLPLPALHRCTFPRHRATAGPAWAGHPLEDPLWAGPPSLGPLSEGLLWVALCSSRRSRPRLRIQERGHRRKTSSRRRILSHGFELFQALEHYDTASQRLPAIAGLPSLQVAAPPPGGGSSLGGSPFFGSSLGGSLGGSSFFGSSLGGSCFDGSLGGSSFGGSLGGSSFFGSSLGGSSFFGSSLGGSSFFGSSFGGSSFLAP